MNTEETQTLNNERINKIEDKLEIQIQSGFPEGITIEKIKMFIAGYLQSLEDFGAITKDEMDYLYLRYC